VRAVQLIAVCGVCSYTGCGHILQEHTLPTARQRHTRWTADEIAFIQDTLDESLADVALVLDRTYYGVARARLLVKRGILKT
jgi:hypothetical protein